MIHRRDELRASKIMQERALANEKIEFAWNSAVDEVLGDEFVTGRARREPRRRATRRELPGRGAVRRDRPPAEHGAVPRADRARRRRLHPRSTRGHAHLASRACSPAATRWIRPTARRSPRPAPAAWRRSTPSAGCAEHAGLELAQPTGLDWKHDGPLRRDARAADRALHRHRRRDRPARARVVYYNDGATRSLGYKPERDARAPRRQALPEPRRGQARDEGDARRRTRRRGHRRDLPDHLPLQDRRAHPGRDLGHDALRRDRAPRTARSASPRTCARSCARTSSRRSARWRSASRTRSTTRSR